jgi:energy-coupling factor transport system permease protein
MSAMYDLYQPGDSWLHRLDPRSKLISVVCASALWLLYTNLWMMIVALAMVHVALASAHIARERIAWVWKITLPTMFMIALLWVVSYRGTGPAILSFWFIRVTAYNLAQGVTMALRISALAFTIFTWLFTTDQATLIHSLVSLGLPYAWGLTLAMALHYLPTMASILRMISDAQQARALDLAKGNPLQRARAYIPIIVAMLITALRTAESLSRALESRALGAPGRRRTTLRPLHFRRSGLAWVVSSVILTAALFWAHYALGLGADPLRLLR